METTELNPEGKLYPKILLNSLEKDTDKIAKKRVFIKTPSFTEYLERFQNGDADESIKPEVIFCGQQSKAKQIFVIIVLSILLTISSTGIFILWCTNAFDGAILSTLVLKNNTMAYFMWQSPTVKPLLKVHIFNYTNVDEFTSGAAKKLRVQDIGPYVYQESLERINVVFNGNSTVSYQERKAYTFRPDLSLAAHQRDRVVVPNMPMIGAISMAKESSSLVRWGMNQLLDSLDSQTFLNLPAHRFLWGYDDSFVTLAKSVLSFKKDLPYDRFGLLAMRNGTSADRYTIYTGETDLNRLGLINRINGEERVDYWSTAECNRIDGTDGAHFPLDAVHNLERIFVYNKDLCRKLPLEYNESVLVNLKGDVEMPALRYKIPTNVFASASRLPENQCYCHLDSGVCPPEGVFNASPCAHGAPAFASFPHFYLAGPSLFEYIDGMEPDAEKHATYLDIHTNLAFPISGSSKIQLNLMVQKAAMVNRLTEFPDDMILPVAWLEMTLGELPDDVVNVLYHATISAATLKTVLKFSCVIVAAITLSFLLIWSHANYTSKLYQRRLARRRQLETLNGRDNPID